MSEGENRLLFAHVLRGVAAVLVVASHFFDGFWTETTIAPAMIAAPPHAWMVPAVVSAVVAVAPQHALGHLGVAIFFLISGFVIPFSIERQSRLGFLVARALRIWPTYLAGFAVSVAAIVISARWHAMPLPFAWSSVALQSLFVGDLAWRPTIDGVVWTLEIEMRFYLLMLLLAPAIRRGRLAPILAVAGGCLLFGSVVSGVLPQGSGGWHLYFALLALTLTAQMLPYMFIGTVLHLLHRGAIGARAAGVAAALLFVAMALQWPTGLIAGSTRVGLVCYALAAVFFAACWRWGRAMRRAPRPLMWLADVSYPLYAVHGMAGFVIMRLLLERGAPGNVALFVATCLALVTAYGLHRAVEEPTHRLGRLWGRRISAMRVAALATVSPPAA